jgi:hypothetical protein
VTITFITDPYPTCGPNKADVSISGRNILVTMAHAGDGCGADVNPRVLSVTIGTLPVGEYSLTAEFERVQWSGRFVVRNATGQLTAVSMLGGTPVTMLFARQGDEIRFGGTLALNPRVESGALVVTAPRHEPGLYDITIKEGSDTLTIPGGIYFFDPSAPPDGTVFERVLFPVFDSASGAFGSRWMATAAIANPSLSYVETFNRIDRIACIDRPCMELRPPRSMFDVDGTGYPHGAILYGPRGSLVYGLRVREMTRSDDPGVEILPVRDAQFFRQPLTLVNVPASAAYRTKIRMYGIDPLPLPQVSVSILIDGESQTHLVLTDLVRSTDPAQPAYAEFDLQPLLNGRGEHALITVVSPFGAVWAFASAVHNSSQRMIVITPQ